MYFLHEKCRLVLFFLVLAAVSCSKEAYLTGNTFIFEDEKLAQKQKIQLHRGDFVTVKSCSDTACKIFYLNRFEGYVAPKNLLDKKNTRIVTFVRDGEMKKEPDLLSDTLKKVEAGTRGFLLGEQKRWSLVDLDSVRGWVLMDKLYQGESPFKLYSQQGKLTFEFNGKWYIPFVSAERFFSLEKAFDSLENSFSIVRQEEIIQLTIRNSESENRKFVLKYKPIENLKYKNLSLPEEITFLLPQEKKFSGLSDFTMDFEGNNLTFKISKASKELVYLNQIQIFPEEKN